MKTAPWTDYKSNLAIGRDDLHVYSAPDAADDDAPPVPLLGRFLGGGELWNEQLWRRGGDGLQVLGALAGGPEVSLRRLVDIQILILQWMKEGGCGG